MVLQFDDEIEVPEQFYVSVQWRAKGKKVPEHWSFNLLYREHQIYALHVQPTSKHQNNVGKGRQYFQHVIDGIHEHIWVEEGQGYAEPISVPQDSPEIMWRMFLKRAKINQADFTHPDDGQGNLDL